MVVGFLFILPIILSLYIVVFPLLVRPGEGFLILKIIYTNRCECAAIRTRFLSKWFWLVPNKLRHCS